MLVTGRAKEQGRGLPQEEPRLKLDELGYILENGRASGSLPRVVRT